MFFKLLFVLTIALFSIPFNPVQTTPAPKTPDTKKDRPESKSEYSPIIGERLTYDVSWADFVVAGELTVETKERRSFEGVDGFHVTAQAQSVGLVSAVVYKVNDVYDSYINAATLQPFRASKSTRHGKTRQQSSSTLDQGRTASLNDGQTIPIPSNTYDVASLFYAVRAMDLTPGKAQTFTLIEDGKLYDIKAEVEGREKITSRGRSYDVMRVATKAVRSGSKKDPYQLKFYITNDAKRLPVMMTAEPSWGSVRMELTGGGEKR